MEQNKSNFAIPAEQRQKWYSIALVWIGAMICVSSLMVGGMLGNGMKLGTCALTIVVGYGIVCIYMCFMGMQGCDTGLPTAVMAGGSLGEKGGKYVISAILALACIGWDVSKIPEKTWVQVTARVALEHWDPYGEENGPVLHVTDLRPCEKPAEEVVQM